MNFVDCESFLESNSSDILALCGSNLDDSIDSSNFSVRGQGLIQKEKVDIDGEKGAQISIVAKEIVTQG